MNNCFILLAAGQSKRFKSKKPKQFTYYKGKLIYEHSVDKVLESGLFDKIIVVVKKKSFLKKKYPKNVKIILGGKERCDSSLIGLMFARKFKPKNIFIHDAARPNFSINLLKKLLKKLKKYDAVIPYVRSKDSTKYNLKNDIYNLNRKNLLLTQTPQAFKFNKIFELSKTNKTKIHDESSLFINKNYNLKFIPGELSNFKITYNNDVQQIKTYYGIGFDIHKLIKKKKLYLGGIKIPYHSGLQGHSDGDVIIHSIIDAIVGATRNKDIGTLYPSNKNKFKNIRSTKMLIPVLQMLKNKNFYINNVDINLICERPKVSKYRNKIINSLKNLMQVNENIINLKGKTVEKLGLIGREKAIACEVIVSINKYE